MSSIILIRKAQKTSLCQFSKQKIIAGELLMLFTEYQYNNYISKIKQYLSFIPDEIINIIIEKTHYKNYINQWGILKYVDWLNASQWQGFQCFSYEDNEEDH